MNPVIEIEQRVRYSETDQMGVAHNKSYFEWFEIGRTEFCRQKRIPYKEIEAQGYYLMVVEASCQYRQPLHYDEVFLIRVTLREAAPKKVVFEYELLTKKERRIIATGSTIHIATNSRGEISPLSEQVLKRITAE
jgi:acyl-CoA thioester hydrolase